MRVDGNPELAIFQLQLEALKNSLNQKSTLIFDERTPPFDLFKNLPKGAFQLFRRPAARAGRLQRRPQPPAQLARPDRRYAIGWAAAQPILRDQPGDVRSAILVGEHRHRHGLGAGVLFGFRFGLVFGGM